MEASSYSADSSQGCRERSKRLAAIVAGQDAYVVAQATDEFDQPSHGPLIHVCMQVTDVEQGKRVEQRWQFLGEELVMLDTNAFRVSAPACVQSGYLKGTPRE